MKYLLIAGCFWSSLLLSQEPSAAFSEPPMGTGNLLLNETFESTPMGKIPSQFTNNGPVSVVEGAGRRGGKCLKIDPLLKGPRMLKLVGDSVKSLGGEFWGRLYYKVLLPAPLPEGKGIHTTMVSATGVSPLVGDTLDVRFLGTSMNPSGTFSYMYNVQPPNKRKEFGKNTKATNTYSGEWVCAEWYVNADTQTYRFFIDGFEVTEISFTKGAGNFTNAELPSNYTSMSFGWLNYQPAQDPGYTVWIDDIALAKERIGTR